MSTRSVNIVLTAICLGLAGTLAYAVFLLRKPLAVNAESDPLIVTNTITQTQIAVRKINPSNLLAALANRPLSWGSIESTNYQVFMANLRSIGCPEETIRDIILTDVAKLYGRRRAALRSGEVYRYWEPDPQWEEGGDPQLQAQLRDIDREQNTLVRQLLGVDFQTEMSKYLSDGVDYQQRMFGFLPDEKRQQVAGLQQKYDDLEQAVYARSKGILLAEDEAELKRIQQEKEREFASLLTPQEMEQYELRSSSTAAALRNQLNGFGANEEEFRNLYRLQKTFDQTLEQQFAGTDPASSAEAKARAQQAASEALQEEVRKTLGDKRYREYVRSQDEDYRSLRQLSERLQLPQEMAGRVYDMKREAERQKERIEADPWDPLESTCRHASLSIL